MRYESSGVISVFIVCTPDELPFLRTTSVAEPSHAVTGEREREQAQDTGAAGEQSRDAATDDKKLEHPQGDKAGKDEPATAAAKKAGTGQSDRTSGAYRLL